MKRTVSLLLSIITVISLFVGTVTFGSVGASAAYMVGDVDGDGKIGINDYLALKSGIQTNVEYSGTQRIFADLNGDGIVTSVDIMMMVGYINGTVTSLATAIDPGYDELYDYVTIVKDSNLTYNAGNDSTGGTATVTDSGAGVTLTADSDTTDEYWELNLGGKVIDANKKYTVIFKLQNSVSNVGVGCVKDKLIKDEAGNTIIRGGKTKKGGNPTSCGFHIRYGKFDYITCGDLTGATQNRVAYYFRDFIGEGKLEAFKAHHHLSKNAWGGQMREWKFCPQVVLNQNFYQKQPDAGLLSYIYGWTKEFFTTNAHPAAIAANPEIFKAMAGYNGHIVLRVLPGGDKFYVYMLDDSNFDYRVKSIHGPYKSK
jgi:hypothetical protein